LYAAVNLKRKYLITEDCARHIVQLKLTTDRHEAWRGLSATARLLVLKILNALSDVLQITHGIQVQPASDRGSLHHSTETDRPRWHSTMVLQSSIGYGLQFPVLMLLDLGHHCVI